MGVTINGAEKLKGLTHAEQNTALAYFNNAKTGMFTILGYGKATAVAVGAAGLTGAAITVFYKGPGARMSGSETFGVPGPEVGTGLSFIVAVLAISVFTYFRSKRTSEI